MTKGSVTGGQFLSKMREGWTIRNLFYMLIGEMYTLTRKKHLLRVVFLYKFHIIMVRSYFRKW